MSDDKSDGNYVLSHQQSLQSETSSASLGFQSNGDEPQVESEENPAKKLQEAGESLSHTHRKKRHFQKHEETIEELLSKV